MYIEYFLHGYLTITVIYRVFNRNFYPNLRHWKLLKWSINPVKSDKYNSVESFKNISHTLANFVCSIITREVKEAIQETHPSFRYDVIVSNRVIHFQVVYMTTLSSPKSLSIFFKSFYPPIHKTSDIVTHPLKSTLQILTTNYSAGNVDYGTD